MFRNLHPIVMRLKKVPNVSGGHWAQISIDQIIAEKRFQLEPRTELTPEKLFERSWAVTLLDRVRDQLREHYAGAHKRERFEHLVAFLPGSESDHSYSQVAAKLSVSEGALRVELHRMKGHFRKLLRAEIAHTVSTATEINDELRHLIEVFQD